MEQNLLEKTGKTLEEWKQLLANQTFNKHGEYMTFLKKEHNVTHGFANFITLKFREADAASFDTDTLIQNQYAGKEALKTIFDALNKKILEFGPDVNVSPKKGSRKLQS